MKKKIISAVLASFLTTIGVYADQQTVSSQTQTVNNDLVNQTNINANTVNESYNNLQNGVPNGDTKLQSPLQHLLSSLEWPLFLKEFEITLKLGVCCPDNNFLNCAIGFKAHMAEPIGFFETSQSPFYFPFADLHLGNRMKTLLRSNSLMNHSFKSGETTPRSVTGQAHFIYLPIFGMIFKKKMNFVCFNKGNLVIPYMSEFNPAWKIDTYYSKFMPQMFIMLTPQGMVSGLFDCIASETVNALHGYSSGYFNPNTDTQSLNNFVSGQDLTNYTHRDMINASRGVKFLNNLRDTIFYIDGCNGFAPVGGYVNGDDPIDEATLTFYGIMAQLHGASMLSPVPFLKKQVDMSFDSGLYGTKVTLPSGSPDTWCAPKRFPLPIASQYLLQLAYPFVAGAKELGVLPPEVSTAHNHPGAVNSSVYYVWERRDYYAFAYECPNDDDDEGYTLEGSGE